MIPERITGAGAYKTFSRFADEVYEGNRFYRGTEHSVEKLVLGGKGAYASHSEHHLYLLRDGNDVVARFALIHDRHLPGYAMLSYFEAHEHAGDIFPVILQEAKRTFPQAKKLVAGLNAHLNYGAGILLNRFDEVPVFGLPYNPPWYADYFAKLHRRTMVTFRFDMTVYDRWARSYADDRNLPGLRVRFLDKKQIARDSAIYTRLNNQAFIRHPYWANRLPAEDLELFEPFRFFLDEENLVFAEVDGEPAGFFLWYPDFNQLMRSQRDLNAIHLAKYRIFNPIDTYRFTEIGIIPKYQRTPVALALLQKALPYIMAKGYHTCEGGFIFEENRQSMAFVRRLLTRSFGVTPQPYRRFAVFETPM